MKLSYLLEKSKIEYKLLGSGDVEISDITFDSRRAGEGVLLFCLVGSAADGHDYVMSAYNNGCRAFVVSRDVELPRDAVTVRLDNTRKALPFVAAAFFDNPAADMKIIGITGTKGKTSIASMIYACLNSIGVPCGYIGTSGVDFPGSHEDTKNTTPESLELHRIFRNMLDANVKHCVLEVSSQALFNYRVDGIDFYIGIFTNLSPDHIGPTEHPDFDHYKSCKKRLFSLCRHGIFNADDEYCDEMIKDSTCTVTRYSLDNEAELRGENLRPFESNGLLCIGFDAVTEKERLSAYLPFPGRFSVLNALAALATADLLGLSLELSCEALGGIAIKGRFEAVPLFSDRAFIIDYAHNEVSMKTLLKTVKEYNPERIITLFGSVGGRTKNRRRELGTVCNSLSDFSVISSDNPGEESPLEICEEIASYFTDKNKFVIIPDRETAVRYAVAISRPGDVVLLCGKGHENYQLVGKERVPFCERKILLDEYKKITAD